MHTFLTTTVWLQIRRVSERTCQMRGNEQELITASTATATGSHFVPWLEPQAFRPFHLQLCRRHRTALLRSFDVGKTSKPVYDYYQLQAKTCQRIGHNSSAVAEMGDRLATVDTGRGLYGRRLACVRKPRKWGGAAMPFPLGGSWVPI